MIAHPRHAAALLGLAVCSIVLGMAASAVGRPLAPPAASAARLERPPERPAAQATITPGHIVVRGRLYYTDRLGDRNHPAAGVKVEIWDRDFNFPATGQKLDETVTDADGFYQSKALSNRDEDGPAGQTEGTQDVFIKAHTDNGTVRLLETGTNRAFDWTSYEFNPRDGQLRNVRDGIVGFPTQFIVENTDEVEALWTFVNLAEAWRYMKDTSGEDPGELTAFWSSGSVDGPRYDLEARTLHFRDEDAGFDDVVIQHAAYALLHNLYGALPEPWKACVANVPADPRVEASLDCALLHGFAAFLPAAVHTDPEYETPSLRRIDLDAAAAGTAGWSDGDLVPGRIAGAFWDLHENDPTEEQFDRFNATFVDVWEVFDQVRPVTMPEWWEGWKALGNNGCTAVGSLFQNTIDYNTGPQINPIPDVVIDEDESVVVDLKNYVTDAECADDTLVFRMIDAGAPEAGVRLMPTNVISITPEADWFGITTVVVGVSDGLVDAELSFKVIINAVNDCPTIAPRVPDPPPTASGQPITLELEKYGRDEEDAPADLAWDIEADPPFRDDLTILGRGTTTLTVLPDPRIRDSYSAIVTLVVRDRNGCAARQRIALYWTSDRNRPPRIDPERFTRHYTTTVNNTITVDLTGVAEDEEDPPGALSWFVLNPDALPMQVNKVASQVIEFQPDPGLLGTHRAELEVQDSGGARATAGISLTWVSRLDTPNLPPRILRHLLVGKTVGVNSEACYELSDKAVDPDHNVLSLRWFAEPEDDATLFVGPQGRRELCLRSRPNFEGCQVATFIVRDPRHAEDRHDVRTCWRTIHLYAPVTVQMKR